MDAPHLCHPSRDDLYAFRLGKLDQASTASILKHLKDCPDCRREVAVLTIDPPGDQPDKARSLSGTPAPDKSLASLSGSLKGGISSSADPSSPAALPPELAASAQYEVLRELGRGGMGVVYLAKNRRMDRLEVLKVINKALLERPGAVERFLREIRSAAQLSHPNVVRAYSVPELGELLAFAMEYIEGENLAELVKARGPRPVALACYYAYQAASGLQHAFEKGMIHRDIKPHNLILATENKRPIVKILDFGLAKATREKGLETGLTGTGQMLGTPEFIAPEQMLDAAKADIRADIYSLGCTLYFLLTGRPPFQGKSLFEVLQAHLHEEARPVNVERPEVPVELAAVVAKMMAKDPAKRFQQPTEVAQALLPFIKQAATKEQRRAGTIAPAAGRERQTMQRAPAVAETRTPQSRELAEESRVPLRKTRHGTVPEARPASAPKPAEKKRWLVGAGVLTCLLLSGLIGIWAGDLFKVKTKHGILVVDVNEPNPDVYIDGERVSVSWGNDGKKAEISVKPGTRKVVVTKDGFSAHGEEVTLKDGDRRILTAKLDSLSPIPQKTARPVPADTPEAARGETAKTPPPLAKAPFNATHARDLQRAWAAYLSRKVEETVDLGAGVMMEVVLIPPGTFTMGSPPYESRRDGDEVQHDVTITRPFYLAKYPVTQEQYQRLVGLNPSQFCASGADKEKVRGLDTARFPVETVSWEEAFAYCQKLTQQVGWRANLPTEAEWEYACRAGTTSPFSFGNELNGTHANCDGNYPYGTSEKGPYQGRTYAVHSYQPNALGLYGMHGNVWQWCQDWYGHYDRDERTDPSGPPTGTARVARGGSWMDLAEHCRSAYRVSPTSGDRKSHIGFRVALRLN